MTMTEFRLNYCITWCIYTDMAVYIAMVRLLFFYAVTVHLGSVSDHCSGVHSSQLAARNITICTTV